MISYYGELCTKMYESDKSLADGKELDFYLSFADRKDISVLEPMCGNGRMLIPFMQRDIQIEGFDISEDMLKVCIEKGNINKLEPKVYYQKIEESSDWIQLEKRYINNEWIVISKKAQYHKEQSTLFTKLKYQVVTEDKIEKTEIMDFPLRLYDVKEFENILKTNGFRHIQLHEVKDGYGEGNHFHVFECSLTELNNE
ncbi:class I SAM-dependent methyltransferase [Paenibacillus sp. FSL H8-0537]|uniref:class I SAM-dependent methyltransferase n=1 Tax=Paenibacillus sp. FSL H8-0537 TaxID=2921399 RepID=UPI003100C6F9